MTMRYLLDENVDPIIRRELQSREATMVVWRSAIAANSGE